MCIDVCIDVWVLAARDCTGPVRMCVTLVAVLCARACAFSYAYVHALSHGHRHVYTHISHTSAHMTVHVCSHASPPSASKHENASPHTQAPCAAHVNVQASVRARRHALHTHMHPRIRTCVRTRARTHARMYTCAHVRTYARAHVRTSVRRTSPGHSCIRSAQLSVPCTPVSSHVFRRVLRHVFRRVYAHVCTHGLFLHACYYHPASSPCITALRGMCARAHAQSAFVCMHVCEVQLAHMHKRTCTCVRRPSKKAHRYEAGAAFASGRRGSERVSPHGSETLLCNRQVLDGCVWRRE